VLADLLTISEKLGKLKGVKVTWVGDGNNVCNSWLLAVALTGIELTVATPAELQPDKKIVERARSMGASVELSGEPFKAVKGCDVIYTDVWVSMGDETEEKRRKQLLKPFQVNEELVTTAKSDTMVMHCLPAHRGQEITGGVIDGPQSVVFDQAENRMHAQRALLYRMLVL
jgi:ornithine carbamoyltransferase